MWREEKDKDMTDIEKITEIQKEGKGVEKEVITVIQTNERIGREVAERKRAMINYGVKEEINY